MPVFADWRNDRGTVQGGCPTSGMLIIREQRDIPRVVFRVRSIHLHGRHLPKHSDIRVREYRSMDTQGYDYRDLINEIASGRQSADARLADLLRPGLEWLLRRRVASETIPNAVVAIMADVVAAIHRNRISSLQEVTT